MNKQGELILTSDNFFDSIEFQKKSELEQVSYILFYITEVAHLRKDMIPEIIADRIRDQFESFFQRNPGADKDNYTPIKTEQVLPFFRTLKHSLEIIRLMNLWMLLIKHINLNVMLMLWFLIL